ncbi:MAG: endonuclease/exonuclease/phosphatase family protein [Clostridia bacterium]|nr:endonuclease/exonuclease/phosphatase family protein [Clostridia bacterium]
MKIMTFNTQHCLNFLTQKIDYEIMAKTIKECGADLVGLNEMFDGENGIYGKQTQRLSALTELKNHFFARAIYEGVSEYGNGILSSCKIKGAQAIPIPDPSPKAYTGYYETRVLLRCELENGYTVLITHFGLNRDEQENAQRVILENLTDTKCILMGDFNIEPNDDLLIPIRERMQDTEKYMSGNIKTFPSNEPRIKIDYIFLSPDIKIKSAEVVNKIASDHRPIIVEIE